MIWSISSFKQFQRFQRKWFLDEKVGSRSNKDAYRKEIYLLSQLESVEAWRGKIVDYTISEFIIPKIQRKQAINQSEVIEFAKRLSRTRYDFAKKERYKINGIKVHKVIYEDYSAKTFNRPEWSNLLASLKKTKGQSDLILFTKWDRFSRNAGDAYQMISMLRKLGIEPQAIEQPLDLSIPENKMMLAFYLAAPEVENDRRELNTFFGMRRAKKEGR